MSDKQPNPAPDGKPVGDDPLTAIAGSSIDDLLAEAESLASELAHEVGVTDTDDPAGQMPEEPPGPDAFRDSQPPDPAGADAAVAERETMLSQRPEARHFKPTGSQALPADEEAITYPAAEPPADGMTAPPYPRDEEPAAAVITTTEPLDEDPLQPDAVPAWASPVSPTTSESDDHAIVDDEIYAAAAEKLREAPVQAATPPAPGPDQPAADGGAGGLLRRVTRRLCAIPRLIASVPHHLLTAVLALIDLPFAWMSPSLKYKLGYIGIVTAIMAAIAWTMVVLGFAR